MASKKEKAPLQPSESNDVNEPKIKKGVKTKPAAAQEAAAKTTIKETAKAAINKEETSIVNPETPPETIKKAAKKAAAKKAATAPEEQPTKEVLVKPKKTKAAKTKIAIPFEPVKVQEVPAATTPEFNTQQPEKTPEHLANDIEPTADEKADKTISAITELSLGAAEMPAEPTTEPEEHAAVTEAEEPAAQEPAETQTQINKSARTITFYIRFGSRPGQNLFIAAQHPLFGNGNPEAALPMQYFNEETWTAALPVDDTFAKEPIVYNYLLKEADGTYVYDAGSDKVLDAASYTSGEVQIVDSWNVAGFVENAFYTEPFKEVLLKNNDTAIEYTTPVTFTHTFKLKAPLLTQGQVPYISGGIEALSNWSFNKHLLFHKAAGEDVWLADVDLTDALFPFEYKYGVYDVRAGKAVQLENGDNRSFYDTIEPDKKTIVNDGFIRLPANTWKGAGVAIPVFSLKSENSFGAGEFTNIKILADWAKSVGIKLIQLLPVNDTTAYKTKQDSYPYAAISAFALHAMYLNLGEVVNEENKHFLEQYEAESKQLNALPAMDYEKVNDIKWKVIHHIYPLQKDAVFSSEDYQAFFNSNKHWLVPYAAFCYLRDKNNTADFSRWPQYKAYNEHAISGLLQLDEVKEITGMYYFVQYHLHLQLKDAAAYAHSQGIIVKGDIAIGVSRYGADTWQEPELFNMSLQAGAPPDDFAVKGQNWSFPTYNWQKMQEDGFDWWKRRFEQMSRYFDAFRIDHILGFFRIWSIPANAIQGILGHFVPALPVHVNEFYERGIYFDYNRYTKPFINDEVLNNLFGNQQWWVKDNLLHWNSDGTYTLKEEVSTQKRVETYFTIREDNLHNHWLKNTLFDLVSNIILFEEKESNGQLFHFRFGIEETLSYKLLDPHTQWQLKQLYVNYFYERQDDFWYHEAMKKLPALKKATNMLICGEDLGMVPATVPKVMNELGLLSLEVQRMPKDNRHQFTPVAAAPYLSVVTPSTHDMSTIRGWWEEDRNITQAFFNHELGQHGETPQYCEPWINKLVVDQHLQSPAMWSIFQLQDLMGSDGNLRRANPNEERINIPAIPNYYWQYRMHKTLEELMSADEFNNTLKESIANSGR